MLNCQLKDLGASPDHPLTSCDALGTWPPQSERGCPSCKVSRWTVISLPSHPSILGGR